jgi:hypothetical protein
LTETYLEHWVRLFDVLQSQIDARFPDGPPGKPWDPGKVDSELQFKNALLWTGVEWIDPATGKTPLRSFVETEVHDPRLAEALLWNEHPVHGTWRINRFVGEKVELEDETIGKIIRATIGAPYRIQALVGWTVTGQLYRWGEGLRLAGVMNFAESPESVFARTGFITNPDMVMRTWEGHEVERAESMVLSMSDPLERIFARYPSQWVDGMARALGLSVRGRKREKACQIAELLKSTRLQAVIQKLPEESLAALRWLESKGWNSPLGTLDRLYSVQVGMFWDSAKPATPVGQLRIRGLVVAGRVRGPHARLFKTAFVPEEIRPRLEEYLRRSDTPRYSLLPASVESNQSHSGPSQFGVSGQGVRITQSRLYD